MDDDIITVKNFKFSCYGKSCDNCLFSNSDLPGCDTRFELIDATKEELQTLHFQYLANRNKTQT